MKRVVDASVAVRWYVNSPGTEAATALLEDDVVRIAPDLVVPEVINTAWKLVRGGEISAEHGRRIASAAPLAFARLVPATELAERGYAIATALGHPVYDGLYLALAEAESLPLVTADRRLQTKVANSPWQRWVEPLA